MVGVGREPEDGSGEIGAAKNVDHRQIEPEINPMINPEINPVIPGRPDRGKETRTPQA